MNQYYPNEVIEAIQVAYLQGSQCSEKKKPKDKDLIDLGNTFVSQHNVREGDYVIFRNGLPDQVMSGNTFETDYSPVPEAITDEEAEATLAS